jgi:hypothetical protein
MVKCNCIDELMEQLQVSSEDKGNKLITVAISPKSSEASQITKMVIPLTQNRKLG